MVPYVPWLNLLAVDSEPLQKIASSRLLSAVSPSVIVPSTASAPDRFLRRLRSCLSCDTNELVPLNPPRLFSVKFASILLIVRGGLETYKRDWWFASHPVVGSIIYILLNGKVGK